MHGAGQAFQTFRDKEALSTTVILWRRRGSAAGLLLHRGLQNPYEGSHTHTHTLSDRSAAGEQVTPVYWVILGMQPPPGGVNVVLSVPDDPCTPTQNPPPGYNVVADECVSL